MPGGAGWARVPEPGPSEPWGVRGFTVGQASVVEKPEPAGPQAP